MRGFLLAANTGRGLKRIHMSMSALKWRYGEWRAASRNEGTIT
jgi:hypothetical protein